VSVILEKLQSLPLWSKIRRAGNSSFVLLSFTPGATAAVADFSAAIMFLTGQSLTIVCGLLHLRLVDKQILLKPRTADWAAAGIPPFLDDGSGWHNRHETSSPGSRSVVAIDFWTMDTRPARGALILSSSTCLQVGDVLFLCGLVQLHRVCTMFYRGTTSTFNPHNTDH
jgi:hypothetical protein